MKNWHKCILAAAAAGALIGAFGVVGKSDYADAQKETAHYCEMVRGGFWPDFKDMFQRVCVPSQSARKTKA